MIITGQKVPFKPLELALYPLETKKNSTIPICPNLSAANKNGLDILHRSKHTLTLEQMEWEL